MARIESTKVMLSTSLCVKVICALMCWKFFQGEALDNFSEVGRDTSKGIVVKDLHRYLLLEVSLKK